MQSKEKMVNNNLVKFLEKRKVIGWDAVGLKEAETIDLVWLETNQEEHDRGKERSSSIFFFLSRKDLGLFLERWNFKGHVW